MKIEGRCTKVHRSRSTRSEKSFRKQDERKSLGPDGVQNWIMSVGIT